MNDKIGTALYKGQGFGNQLWVYSTAYAASKRLNLSLHIINPNLFKGKSFIKLEYDNSRIERRNIPTKKVPEGFDQVYFENKEIHPIYNCDVSPFDEGIYLPQPGSFLEGPMQSENYILQYKNDLSRMFATNAPEFEGCVINLRGGEYKNNKELFLNKKYYSDAIFKIKELDPDCEFLVVTDDSELAKDYFPDFKLQSSGGVKILLSRFYFSPRSENIGKDFGLIQNSKYLILSNSSFSWWGAWTNKKVEYVIAPKYWARHNVSDGFWSQGDSLTRDWVWLDRNGEFFTYEQSLLELKKD